MDDAASGISTSVPPTYVKYVSKQFAKIEVRREGGREGRREGGMEGGREGEW